MNFRTSTLALSIALLVALQAQAQTIIVSQSSAALLPDGRSYSPDVGEDPRYIVFASDATNLAPGDTNGVTDIFLHEQETIQLAAFDPLPIVTTRISVSNEGVEANGPSGNPRISANGRWIVFSSAASNLVAGDTNNKTDIFLYDRENSSIRRVSVPLTIFGVETGESNGDSVTPSISDDGCYIVYASDATNLQALGQDGAVLPDTNGKRDIFMYTNPSGTDCDLTDASNEFISINSTGEQADGDSSAPVFGSVRYIGFVSEATNLVGDDANGVADVFIRDRVVSIGDGRITQLVSRAVNGAPANGASYSIDVDGGGDITFDSDATDLVVSDTNGKRDVFRRFLNGDRSLGATELVSSLISGEQGDGDSRSPSIAAGGNYIAFASDATNLSGRSDCNAARDIIIHDYILDTVRRVNLSTSGYQATSGLDSDAPSISSGSILVVYETAAIFQPSDDNQLVDIYGSVASKDPASRDNPLTAGERLDEAPDVCTVKRSATVFMEKFSEVASSGVSSKASGRTCPKSGICYMVLVKPLGKTALKTEALRKVSKRNQTSFRSLPPGNYRVSFRVRGESGSTAIRTNRSPLRTISIPRRR